MMDAFHGTGFDLEMVKSIIESAEIEEAKGQYLIAWWKGGEEDGSWFPTTYRFDDYADAQEKIRELSKDGHTYKAFDDAHGLPDTKESKEISENEEEKFMLRVTDSKGEESYVTGEESPGIVRASQYGDKAKSFGSREEAQAFIDKHEPKIPGKVSFKIIPDNRHLNPMTKKSEK